MRGRSTPCAGALAALAAIWLLTGCGGHAGPTKADFVAKASAICRSVEQQLKDVGSVPVEGGFEAKLEEGAKALAQSVAELRKIPLPPHEAVPREWLRFREQAAAAAKRVSDAAPSSGQRRAASEEEFKAKQSGSNVARSYGLTDCLNT